jgi:hypothetical protein
MADVTTYFDISEVSGFRFQVAEWIVKSKKKLMNVRCSTFDFLRVGCAHRISQISSVKGGQSPPYTLATSPRRFILNVTACFDISEITGFRCSAGGGFDAYSPPLEDSTFKPLRAGINPAPTLEALPKK